MAYPPVTNAGVVTSWIPLTTSYSPPASCSSLYRLEAPSLVAFDPAYGIQNDPTAICQPSAVTTWWEQGYFGDSGSHHTAVSILPLICPYGWSTVATSRLDDATTQAMCCPSHYTLANRIPPSVNGNCQSPLASGQIVTYASTGVNTNHWVMATTTLQQASFAGAIGIVGYAVSPLAIQPAQTSSATTHSSSTTTGSNIAQSSPAPNTSRTSPASNTSQPSPTSSLQQPMASTDQNESTLSTGTKAGIGVGAALGFIGIAALLVALWILLRRKSRAIDTNNATGEQAHHDEKRFPNGTTGYPPNYEWAAHELPGFSQPQELTALKSPAEMYAPR